MKLFNKKILTLAVLSVLSSGTAMMAGTLQADEQTSDLPPPPPGPYAAKQTWHANAQNILSSSVEMIVSEEAPAQQAEVSETPAQEVEVIKIPLTQPVLTAVTAVPVPSESIQAEEAPAEAEADPQQTEVVQAEGAPAEAEADPQQTEVVQAEEAPAEAEADPQQTEVVQAEEAPAEAEADSQQTEVVQAEEAPAEAEADLQQTETVTQIVVATPEAEETEEVVTAAPATPAQPTSPPPAQARMMYAQPQMPMPGYGYPAGAQQMPMQVMPGYANGQQAMPMMYMPMPRVQYIYVVPVMPGMQAPMYMRGQGYGQRMRSRGQHVGKQEHGKDKKQSEAAEQ